MPLSEQEQMIQRTATRVLANSFEVDGKRFDEIITDGQLEILQALLFRDTNRLQILCCTQYGKSLVVALACLIITCVQKKVVAVIAPSSEKAKIIMRYYIEHLSDSVAYYTCLEKNTRLDRLRQEGSKSRIILNQGGGIFVVSTDERNSKKNFESAMGLGASIVIQDESCLISDKTEATIFRMIAGKGQNAFYCKIGNPFYVEPPYSHFKKSWDSGLYKKIFIDDKQALAEGRYTEEYLNEAIDKPMYDQLCRCVFPDEDVIDKDGWRKLIMIKEVEKKIKFLPLEERIGEVKIGVDVATGGKDFTTIVASWDNYARVEIVLNTKNTMDIIPHLEDTVAKYSVKWYNVSVDDIGVGHGLSDRLKEKGYSINSVSVGDKCKKDKDKATFFNLKAQISWLAKKWLEREDTFLEPYQHKGNNVWFQIGWIRYKENSERTMQIEPKDSLIKKYGKSPDFADAFFLTHFIRYSAGIIKMDY